MARIGWDEEASFRRQVERRGPRQCWGWTGPRDGDGYGRFVTPWGSVAAHREAYRHSHPDDEDFGRLVHTCGNRACVNPGHLREQEDENWQPRFWSKVDRRGPTECWPWTGARRADGYGVLRVRAVTGYGARSMTRYAHRLSWELAHKNRHFDSVTHTCDNRACVNPAHLDDGDPSNRRGLTEEDIEDIRERAARGEPQSRLAREYRVSASMISRIVSRARWT